jgi:hypothetical protein
VATKVEAGQEKETNGADRMKVFFQTRMILIPAFAFVFALPTQPEQQQQPTPPSKDACKDVCLGKEIADFTRIVDADGERIKIFILAEDLTWTDDYRRIAKDIIQSDFSDRFVPSDSSFGVVMLYLSGTAVVSNGAQFVNVRLQINSSEILLPESWKMGLHTPKIGDPSRLVEGWLVFSEHGILLPPIGGMNFELWHQINIQKVRENIKQTLSDFAAKWDAAGQKK